MKTMTIIEIMRPQLNQSDFNVKSAESGDAITISMFQNQGPPFSTWLRIDVKRPTSVSRSTL